ERAQARDGPLRFERPRLAVLGTSAVGAEPRRLRCARGLLPVRGFGISRGAGKQPRATRGLDYRREAPTGPSARAAVAADRRARPTLRRPALAGRTAARADGAHRLGGAAHRDPARDLRHLPPLQFLVGPTTRTPRQSV